MASNSYEFSNVHKQNIKTIFEEKSGIKLKKQSFFVLYRKIVITVLSIVLCVFVALPVSAANVPDIYNLMYQVSPSIAQFYKPIQKSDEYDGIKMEVVSAYIHENVIEIYITMQDLTGNRIDGSTDLYDSYSVNRSFGGSGFCQQVGYDEESKTATFLITIEEWGRTNISGSKITFSVRQFLSNKTYYEDIEIPIDPETIGIADNVHSVMTEGIGGLDRFIDDDYILALVPSTPHPDFPVRGMELTGIGYIDGLLHIQTATADRSENDNHGYFYLLDNSGNRIQSRYTFYASNGYDFYDSEHITYVEDVFDIPMEEIADYSIWGYFVTADMRTEGYWSVTFPLEKAVSTTVPN